MRATPETDTPRRDASSFLIFSSIETRANKIPDGRTREEGRKEKRKEKRTRAGRTEGKTRVEEGTRKNSHCTPEKKRRGGGSLKKTRRRGGVRDES